MEEKYINNPLMKQLLNYVDKVNALEIYSCVDDYILKEFGENKENILGLCHIRPDKLCELIKNDKYIFEDILYIIFAYKLQNNLDIGFNKDVYLKEFELYDEKHRKKIYRTNKKKIYKTVYETFDKYIDTTYEEYLDYLKDKYDIKLVDELSFNSINYKGKKIGKAEVLQGFKKQKPKDNAVWWICRCSCGSYYSERVNRVSKRTSCGKCDYENYIGKINGNLKVIDQKYWIRKNGYSKLLLQVKCNCGNVKIMDVFTFNNSNYCSLTECSLISKLRSKSAYEKQELKKVFYNDTNIFKLDKKKETDINRNNTSGYLGVTLNKQTNKYLAYIYFQHKRYDLGMYGTASYASKVRQQAQAILYGEYAQVVKDDEFIKNNKYLTKLIDKLIEEKNDG